MAKKSFSAGTTKSGVLNNDGGEKLREIQAKAQYNFKYIPKEKIIPNPKNEQYSQDGIEALKESILVNGLRHNLSVLYDAETDLYRLISGERIYHAICQMTDKEYRDNFPAGIPCKVEKSDVNAIDEEIMLISANHDVRESSMEVKRWEVSRLLELYEAKKLKVILKIYTLKLLTSLISLKDRQENIQQPRSLYQNFLNYLILMALILIRQINSANLMKMHRKQFFLLFRRMELLKMRNSSL